MQKRKTSDPSTFNLKNEKRKIIPIDEVDVALMKLLLDKATVSNSVLSASIGESDASIKRRRKKILDAFLTRNYLLDVSKLGWRIGDIQVDVGRGKSEDLAEEIFAMYPNILEISLRVNSEATISARIFYKDNQELFLIIDKIRRLPFVKDVAFSEVIKIVRSRSIGTMQGIFVERKAKLRHHP